MRYCGRPTTSSSSSLPLFLLQVVTIVTVSSTLCLQEVSGYSLSSTTTCSSSPRSSLWLSPFASSSSSTSQRSSSSSSSFQVVKKLLPSHATTTTTRRQRQTIQYATLAMNDSSSSSFKTTTTTTRTAKTTAIKTILQKWRTPMLTLLAASVGVMSSPSWATTTSFGQHFLLRLPLQEVALGMLMLSMGLAISPQEIKQAIQQHAGIIILVMLGCFGLMPFVALQLSTTLLALSPYQTIGTIVLGSVSGGQACNLFFAMLALQQGGGSKKKNRNVAVALSVICTLCTTLAGVVVTPLLIQEGILGSTVVPVQASSMLQSFATLILLPLVSGFILGPNLRQQSLKRMQRRLAPDYQKPRSSSLTRIGPTLGLLATMVLVAGGAANVAASTLLSGAASSAGLVFKSIGVSVLLPLLGAATALGLASWLIPSSSSSSSQSNNNNTNSRRGEEQSKQRTLVIEVLSKSPTLAFVLVLKHFGVAAASIPATAMVALAVLGAVVGAASTSSSSSSSS